MTEPGGGQGRDRAPPAAHIDLAKSFMKFLVKPENLNEYLKGARGRWLPVMPEIVKNDPYWTDPPDPHRPVVVKQEVEGPTQPWPMAYNPAYAQVNAEEIWGKAEGDVVINGKTPGAGGRRRLRPDQGDLRAVPGAEELGLVDGRGPLTGGRSPARPRRQRRAGRRHAWRRRGSTAEGLWAAIFVVPYIAVFVMLVIYPVLYGLWLGSSPASYVTLFNDPSYLKTLWNTFLFLVLGVNIKMFLALMLSGYFNHAVALDQVAVPDLHPAVGGAGDPDLHLGPLDAERAVGADQQCSLARLRHVRPGLADDAVRWRWAPTSSSTSGNGCRSGRSSSSPGARRSRTSSTRRRRSTAPP